MGNEKRIGWLSGIAAIFVLFAAAPAMTQTPALYTRWENFTTANGMPDDKVFSVAVDGERVWAGTENGLVLIENGKVSKV